LHQLTVTRLPTNLPEQIGSSKGLQSHLLSTAESGFEMTTSIIISHLVPFPAIWLYPLHTSGWDNARASRQLE